MLFLSFFLLVCLSSCLFLPPFLSSPSFFLLPFLSSSLSLLLSLSLSFFLCDISFFFSLHVISRQTTQVVTATTTRKKTRKRRIKPSRARNEQSSRHEDSAGPGSPPSLRLTLRHDVYSFIFYSSPGRVFSVLSLFWMCIRSRSRK